LGSRLETAGSRLTEFQTAQLGANDKGWTSWGIAEERRGGPASYGSPHLRYRDFHADLTALVALRLEPSDEPACLDDIAMALDRPKRPIFIGRKNCLPTTRLLDGWVEAATVLEALQLAPLKLGSIALRAQWPASEGRLAGDRVLDLCDERNWTSGVHGGWRPVREGIIRAAKESK
jgi:CRISPR system Cascade subunit CasD